MRQSGDSHVRFVELGTLSAPRSRAPRGTGRLARSILLRPGSERWAEAQAALDELVEQWGLPQHRSRRWLVAAGQVLGGPTPLEMYVQVDGTTDLLTLELWAYGQVVFGIDDWLGV